MCNFVLAHVYFIRLEVDCSKVGRGISDNWKEVSDKVDGLSGVCLFWILVIKNPAVKGWYLLADKASLH